METYDNFKDFEFDASRATPHFNDAQVIKGARPVVPLMEIGADNKNKGRLFLTGAFAAAMLLGAAVALVAARLERQRFQAAAIQVSKVETTNSTAVADTTESEKPEEIAPPEATAESLVVTDTTEPVISDDQKTLDAPESTAKAPVKAVARPVHLPAPEPQHHDEAIATDSVGSRDNVSNDDQTSQQPMKVDEWQERRLRRIEKFDRRARRAAQGRDLMRIDEIFEGSRRP
ncbi:MAG TPA: hypothetical protein VLB68_20480 [Pyrinomonadaceae bacterium]|nr:hypothetical protein [Pyrinomonadaceae bacterium]